jgi:regulator of sirC expression with transglutaminase-like and TPR domain
MNSRNIIRFGLVLVWLTPMIALASLANDGKRGLRISSIDSVFRLPEEEVDLATAALLLSREWGTDKTLLAYRRKIDEMAEEILNRLKDKHLNPDYRAIDIVNQYLFEERGFHSVQTADDPDDLFLHIVLERKRGYCLSLSVLYLSIAERIGMPAYGVVVPGHFFVRYDDGKKQFNIETTSGGAVVDDQYYKDKFKPPVGDKTVYFKNLTKKQSLGCFFNNLGNCYIERGQMDLAYDYLYGAIQVNPRLGRPEPTWVMCCCGSIGPPKPSNSMKTHCPWSVRMRLPITIWAMPIRPSDDTSVPKNCTLRLSD